MADFGKVTREAWDRGFTNEVALAIPLFAMLYEHQRIIFKGGKLTRILMQKGTTESLTQSYFMNEPMSGGKINVLEEAKFYMRYMQHPVQYDAKDIIENTGGERTAPEDAVRLTIDTSQDGFRRFLQSKFWGASSGSHSETVNGSRDITSVLQALTYDAPYGGLTRTGSTSVNEWWQGASQTGTYASTAQATAAAPSLANIAKWATICRRHLPKGRDGRGRLRNPLYMFVPEGIFQDIQTQCEAKTGLVKPSVMNFKYGHNALNVYNVEIVESSWMTLNSHTATMVMLNPATWQFRVAPTRRFRMTPFVWQAEQAGGIDAWLAHILLAGTLTCKMPRGNMFLSAVS